MWVMYIESERSGWLLNEENFDDLAGVYQEVAKEIGREGANAIYHIFHGQQISFPQRFYAREYVLKCVLERREGRSLREIATEYGYTERRIRQLIHQQTKENN